MKKIVLTLICAVLAIQDITIGEKGEASLTEDQLNTLENTLKEKDDRISALEKEKDAAISDKQAVDKAKAEAEQKLATLQKKFDEFKNEAGDYTLSKPADEGGKNEPATAKSMYNSVKNLL